MDKVKMKAFHAVTMLQRERLGETNDCMIYSIAMATQTLYEKVWEMAKEEGRRRRCGTHTNIAIRILRRLGWDIEIIFPTHEMALWLGNGKNILSRHLHLPYEFKTRKVKEFIGERAIAFTFRHALPVVDGLAWDLQGNKRSTRIKKFWRLKRLGG